MRRTKKPKNNSNGHQKLLTSFLVLPLASVKSLGGILYSFYKSFGDKRLSHIDLIVFIYLCCNQEYCSKSAANIAEQINICRRSVFNSLQNLEKFELIKIKKISARRWKIYPLVEKHSASDALSLKSGKKDSARGAPYSARHALSIVHQVHSNSKETIKEQYNSDFLNVDNSGEGLSKILEKEDVSSVLDLMRKMKCSKNQDA